MKNCFISNRFRIEIKALKYAQPPRSVKLSNGVNGIYINCLLFFFMFHSCFHTILLNSEKLDKVFISKDKETSEMHIIPVKIDKPEAVNFIFGQTHFIMSVEDIHEALVAAVPGIKFGLAFCEASGKCLVRFSGTDQAMIELARKNALAIAAGHSFIIFLGEGFYPLNVLNTVKMTPEVCRIFCATANPTEVILAETEQGRGVLGVVDGFSPKGIEDEDEIQWRKNLLRKIGYKL
jgi:uncharacterized protein